MQSSDEQLPAFDISAITITHDRTTGDVTLHTGDLDPWSAWAMLLRCADALAEILPDIKVRDDDNEGDQDDDEAEDEAGE